MVMFGLLYRTFPALATSKLVAVHFILFNLGAVIFLVGIPLAQAHQTVALAAGGSLTMLVGMLAFLANPERIAACPRGQRRPKPKSHPLGAAGDGGKAGAR